MPQTPPRSIWLVLRWLNSPLLRLACPMNRRFAAASASPTMCSDIGSAPPPLLAATGNSDGRSRVGTQSTPAAVNCNSRALRIGGILSGRSSFDVSWDSTASARPRACSGGRRQIDEIDSLGGPIQFFFDDRPGAPRQRIGHYRRPCTHSPALILIHLQYRIFAKIGRRDPVRSHVAWQKSFSP